MRKLKIGLAGLRHGNFPGDMRGVFERCREEFIRLGAEMGFEAFVWPEPLLTESEVHAAAAGLRDKGIDMVMALNCAFSDGRYIEILGKSADFIGLWAVPEPCDGGRLPLNSLCGMHMNNSILKEYVKDPRIKSKWFFGYTGDPLFAERFRITVKALTALVNMRGSKLGLIGGIAAGFKNQYYDERDVARRFGIKVDCSLEFSDIKNLALSYPDEDIRELGEELRRGYAGIDSLSGQKFSTMVRIYKAYADLAMQNNFSALAVSCWPRFRREMDVVACASIGRLNDDGIVTACEGDVYGAVTQYAMSLLSGEPALLMDIVRLDETDESVLLWHCGIGCERLASDEGVCLRCHSNRSPKPGGGFAESAPVAGMIFGPFEGTAARFTHDGGDLFVMTGRFNKQGKPVYDGSGGWMADLMLAGRSISARDLLSTLMETGMQHHVCVGKGAFGAELMELAAWLGCGHIGCVPYTDYLESR